jgi:ribosomal protein S27AE
MSKRLDKKIEKALYEINYKILMEKMLEMKNETKENLCPECGHLVTDHNKITTFGNCSRRVNSQNCPCTRTYESLVGEEIPLPKLPEGASHWMTWGGLGNHKAPPESAKYEQVADDIKAKNLPKALRDYICPIHNVLHAPYWDCDEDAFNTGHDWSKKKSMEAPLANPTAVGVDEPELQFIVIDLQTHCVVKVEKGTLLFLGTLPNVEWQRYDNVCLYDCTFTELRSAISGEKPVPRIEVCGDGYWMFDGTQPGYAIAATTFNALSELAGSPLPIFEAGTWTELTGDDTDRMGLPRIWRYRR